MVAESVLPDSGEDRLIGLAETRAVIEQATGILMATYRCGPGESADMLRLAAHDSGVEVHVLAAKLVDLAERGLKGTSAGYRET